MFHRDNQRVDGLRPFGFFVPMVAHERAWRVVVAHENEGFQSGVHSNLKFDRYSVFESFEDVRKML
jgi:hypothetical protein